MELRCPHESPATRGGRHPVAIVWLSSCHRLHVFLQYHRRGIHDHKIIFFFVQLAALSRHVFIRRCRKVFGNKLVAAKFVLKNETAAIFVPTYQTALLNRGDKEQVIAHVLDFTVIIARSVRFWQQSVRLLQILTAPVLILKQRLCILLRVHSLKLPSIDLEKQWLFLIAINAALMMMDTSTTGVLSDIVQAGRSNTCAIS